MAKASKKTAAKKVVAKKVSEEEFEFDEEDNMIGDDGRIVKETRLQQQSRVILPRDIREAMTEGERKALDKKAYMRQRRDVEIALQGKTAAEKPAMKKHLALMLKVIDKKLADL